MAKVQEQIKFKAKIGGNIVENLNGEQINQDAMANDLSDNMSEVISKGAKLIREGGETLARQLGKIDHDRIVRGAEKLGANVRKHPFIYTAAVIGLGALGWQLLSRPQEKQHLDS